MSRKLSVRIPQPLWAWLIARAGNRSVSAVVVDCILRVKSSSGGGSRVWLWGIAFALVGMALLISFSALRNKRKRKRNHANFI